MRQFHVFSLVAVALTITVCGTVRGQEKKKEGVNQVYPLAVFPFTESNFSLLICFKMRDSVSGVIDKREAIMCLGTPSLI